MAIGRTFDVAKAAKYLDVVEETIRVAARKGYLAGYRDRLHQGGPWRFTQEALDAYRASRTGPIGEVRDHGIASVIPNDEGSTPSGSTT